MGTIRVATFNVENLLQRFNFSSYGRLTKERVLELLGVGEQNPDYMAVRKSLAVTLTDDSRQHTAQAIRDLKADIVCVQEVENRQILDDFHDYYLDRSARVHYGWRRLIDGNDPRGIDVGVMSKVRIDVISHREISFDDFGLYNDDLRAYGLSEGDRIFRRDCLEVNLKVEGNPLSIFACHFKSMAGGRAETRCIREAEAEAVRRIIEDKYGNQTNKSDWLIIGDLNDYTHHEGNPDNGHGLSAFFRDGFSVNLLERLPAKERWTHYYPKENSKHQIDYILASPELAAKNPNAKPDIVRRGQPYRIPDSARLKRYPRVGFDRPKASDHCPVAITLKV